jgi:flagellar protein FlaG
MNQHIEPVQPTPNLPASSPGKVNAATPPPISVVAPKGDPIVKREPLVDLEELRDNIALAVKKLNEQVQSNGRGLNFAMDEVLNRPVITVRSTSTGEVVRQIPTEVVLKVAHNIEEMKGLLMDQTL